MRPRILFYIALGVPFYLFGQAMNPIIRSDGSPRFAMLSTLAGALTNLILDPIFIFLFHWGMMGAAVATVIGQIVTALLAIGYLFRAKTVHLHKKSFLWNSSVIKRFLALGLCSFLAQISLVAAMAAINNMVQKYSALDPIFRQPQYTQIPMAVLGIVMKFFQIVISVSIGLAAGCIPIVGFNIGAAQFDRVKQLLNRLLRAEFLTGLVALIIVELLPHFLISLFGAANESAFYTEFAVKSFRIYLCLLPLACVNKAAFIFLQSMGKAVASTLISMVREIGFGVGLALVMPLRFGLDGILYSMPTADFLTFLISLAVLTHTYRYLRNAGQETD